MMCSRIGCVLASAAFVFAFAAPRGAFAAVPTDACSLVTPAQVGAVLGVPVKAGERLMPTSTTLCGFGGAGARKRVVTAIITPVTFANEKHPFQGIQEEQVSGIGDDAHFMTTPGFGTGLSVKKGNVAFKVRVYGFPVEQAKEKEKALAHEILAKL